MARPRAPRGQARARVIEAALGLFAETGFSGTSLQMIAERLGVTKAAVYYQFRAKEEIVLAVLDDALAEMSQLADAAEAAGTAGAGRDAEQAAVRSLLPGLVDLTLNHRHALVALARDPQFVRIVEEHPDFRSVIERVHRLLLGPAPDVRRRVAVSLIGTGLSHVSVDPELADLDDAALREHLLGLAEGLLLGGGAGD